MKLPVSLLGAVLIAASTTLYAQGPKGDGARFDCSQAKDPKACEERLTKMKNAAHDARKACEGKSGAEHQDCMVKHRCAQSKDPARCEAQGRERMAHREKIRAACKDKHGEELKACVREHRSQK